VIPRTTHCPATGPHHSEQSHGSNSEAPTNTGQGLPTIHRDRRRGEELEQVITAVEQCLEGPVNEAVIQEFTEQEVVAQQQVEATRAKLEDFEAELPRSE
jgi:hypothetical protein